jgi:hypothetical protein
VQLAWQLEHELEFRYFPEIHEVHVPAAPEQVAQEAEQAVH